MTRYFCHEHPDILILETRVVDARPGGVVLEHSPFHPGGGGQLADRGLLRWHGGEVRVTGIEAAGGGGTGICWPMGSRSPARWKPRSMPGSAR